VRRTLTQEYLEGGQLDDVHHINRVLRVFERLVHGFEAQYSSKFLNSLRRDGYVVDEETGHITLAGPRFAMESLTNLTDASAIASNSAESNAPSLTTRVAVGQRERTDRKHGEGRANRTALPVTRRPTYPRWCGKRSTLSAYIPPPLHLVRTQRRGKKILARTGIAIAWPKCVTAAMHWPWSTSVRQVSVRGTHTWRSTRPHLVSAHADTLADPKAPWRKGAAEST